MDEYKEKRLTAKGWKVSNADEFLGLTPENATSCSDDVVTSVQDYWLQRKHLLEILRYLATMGLKLPHWKADAKEAQLLAGAVENDSV